jgi:hypothetical protein
MKLSRQPIHFSWCILSMLIVLALAVSACDPGTDTPTATPEPSPTSVPTEAVISHDPIFTLNPDITDLQAGEDIAILLSFDPPVGVKEAKWEVVAGSGTIEPTDGGDAVVFTAPANGEGAVIIKVSGKTEDGGSFEKKFTLNIIKPAALPPCEFTAASIAPPPFNKSSLEGTINPPERCESNLPVGQLVNAGGIASDIPRNVFLWLLVFAPDGRFYPQCNDATKGLCGANYNAEVWGVPIFLGNPAYPNCKERFYLVLVSVDPDGNDFLTSAMMEQGKKNKFTGFASGDLPEGIEELTSLEVETDGSTNSCPK